jgi:hypothetical protein
LDCVREIEILLVSSISMRALIGTIRKQTELEMVMGGVANLMIVKGCFYVSLALGQPMTRLGSEYQN